MERLRLHIKSTLDLIIKSIIKKPAIVLIIVFGLTALFFSSLLQLKVNPKWTNALPNTDTLVNEYLKLVEDPMRGSVIYAVIEGKDKEKAVDEFSNEALKQSWARFVFDGRISISDSNSSLNSLHRYQLLQHLTITKNINIGQLTELLKTNLKQFLTVPNNSAVIANSLVSWNNFLAALVNALENKTHTPAAQLIDNMIFKLGNRIHSTDNKSLLILVGTNISEGTIDNIDEVANSIESIKNNVLEKYSGTQIKLTGYPISARDEMRSITTSGKKMTIWALILIAAVLIFFYKGWKFVAASIGILIIAIIWTLALNQILFGELNTVTLIMGLVLIGLGIDFSIHWMNYKISDVELIDEKHFDNTHYLKSTATPILAGAFTTAASFLSLLVLNVKSINEFGVMSFLGIILTAVLILILMPIFLKEINYSIVYASLRIKLFHLVEFLLLHKKKVLIFTALLIGFCFWLLPGLKYEYNYAKLQTGGLASYKLKNKIIQEFGFASDVFIHRVKGIDNSNEIKQKLMSSDKIGYVLSVSDFIPTKEKLQKNKGIIEEIINESQLIKITDFNSSDLNSLKTNFSEIQNLLQFVTLDSLTEIPLKASTLLLSRVINSLDYSAIENLNNFNREWVQAFINRNRHLIKNKLLSIVNQPATIRYIFQTSQREEYIQYIYPKNDTWQKENIESLEMLFKEVAPSAVGLPRISWHMSQKILSDIIIMIIVALVIIILTLRVIQKSFKSALLTLVPLSFGILFTLSTLSLLNIKVSLYNLISLPIILGIGIDDGLHIIHAYRENPEGGSAEAIFKVGPAVFLTSLTSMIGFGLLSFYTHPGISSLGVVTFIGVGWCFISTLLFLPIMLEYSTKKLNQIGD
ncbi:MAG: MMPL family transporter [Ignavibacteria bacterium]|nr:MAG: MMPL family transporter [Ignavibacteria bacterium]